MSAPPSDLDYFHVLQQWHDASARLREEISRLSADPGASLGQLRTLHRELQAAQEALQALARPAGQDESDRPRQ